MSNKKLLSMSEFEWASAARYIVYISRFINLKEINSYRVISFPLARLGPVKLLKHKETVLRALDANKKSIERFVGEYRKELEAGELAVLRTLYMQYRENAEVVREHIDIINTCSAEIELGIYHSQEGSDDEQLF